MNQAHAEGGRAEINDRTALLVSIVALAVAVAAMVFSVMSDQAARDRDVGLKDEIIRLEK